MSTVCVRKLCARPSGSSISERMFRCWILFELCRGTITWPYVRSRTQREATMGHSIPFKPMALVVEDDAMQRAMAAMVLEENGLGVVECDCAEDALRVL